jgi:hypothetical protein
LKTIPRVTLRFTRGYDPLPLWGKRMGIGKLPPKGAKDCSHECNSWRIEARAYLFLLCCPGGAEETSLYQRSIEYILFIKFDPVRAENSQKFCFEIFFVMMFVLRGDVVLQDWFL